MSVETNTWPKVGFIGLWLLTDSDEDDDDDDVNISIINLPVNSRNWGHLYFR